MMERQKQRIENALRGLFVADSLAMPAHWIYSVRNLREQFEGGITGFEDAPHPHPEAFFVGMSYHPDVRKAEAAGRRYDILHEHSRFYDTSYSTLEIALAEQESEHGNAVPAKEQRFHYHHGLKAGENTFAAHLVRVLMRSVIRRERYDQEGFLEDFVHWMTTPGNCRDPYREIYVRKWFENYADGLPPHACAATQRAIWSIGSHGGMIRPLVLSMLAPGTYQAIGFALEHQNLTHRSENLLAANAVTVSLLRDVLKGQDLSEALPHYGSYLRVPKVTGRELFRLYREHHGPGNIPPGEMWRLHTQLADEPFDVAAWVRDYQPDEVIVERLATACYPEHGLPLSIYLMLANGGRYRDAVLADVNAGGDNVHRAMITGLITGAASDGVPEEWTHGLRDREVLEAEIEAFAALACRTESL